MNINMNYTEFALKEYKKVFKKVTRDYLDSTHQMYKLKYKHTGDVVRIITLLAQNIGFNDEQIFIAKLAALYHDLGRFWQYRDYQTFIDAESFDHGNASIKMIEKYNILNALEVSVQELIITAIREHNQKYMSDNLSATEQDLSKLLRDADKISNFPFFINNYDKFTLPVSNAYRDEFVSSVLNSVPISNSRANLATMEDIYLYHLSWFNDLNYSESIKYVFDKKYVQKILARILDKSISLKLKEHFNSKMLDKLQI